MLAPPQMVGRAGWRGSASARVKSAKTCVRCREEANKRGKEVQRAGSNQAAMYSCSFLAPGPAAERKASGFRGLALTPNITSRHRVRHRDAAVRPSSACANIFRQHPARTDAAWNPRRARRRACWTSARAACRWCSGGSLRPNAALGASPAPPRPDAAHAASAARHRACLITPAQPPEPPLPAPLSAPDATSQSAQAPRRGQLRPPGVRLHRAAQAGGGGRGALAAPPAAGAGPRQPHAARLEPGQLCEASSPPARPHPEPLPRPTSPHHQQQHHQPYLPSRRRRAAFARWRRAFAPAYRPCLSRAVGAWAKIRGWAGQHLPPLLASLQPGCSEQELEDADVHLGFDVPPALRVGWPGLLAGLPLGLPDASRLHHGQMRGLPGLGPAARHGRRTCGLGACWLCNHAHQAPAPTHGLHRPCPHPHRPQAIYRLCDGQALQFDQEMEASGQGQPQPSLFHGLLGGCGERCCTRVPSSAPVLHGQPAQRCTAMHCAAHAGAGAAAATSTTTNTTLQAATPSTTAWPPPGCYP
jgi:hypothetical protein